MNRLIDAEALKEKMFHYVAPEMVWDRGDIEHEINEMPIIEAIPVEWIQKQRNLFLSVIDDGNLFHAAILNDLIIDWRKEQKA
jgi:hypothetical protein